jgi:hypothetical protein
MRQIWSNFEKNDNLSWIQSNGDKIGSSLLKTIGSDWIIYLVHQIELYGAP